MCVCGGGNGYEQGVGCMYRGRREKGMTGACVRVWGDFEMCHVMVTFGEE